MTRTEDRLTAALESAAAQIRVEASRPLVTPELGRPGRAASRWRGLTGRVHGRRAWLAALPVAASIAVIAVLVGVNGPRPSGPVVTAAYIGGSEPHVPAFFVDAGSTSADAENLRVVSLATGAVTATEHAPFSTADITFMAEQAQTGNYVAAFISKQARGLVLYRFRITGTGKITPLIRIKRILIREQPENITALALSPDGSRLALSLSANTIPAPKGAIDTKVILLDLSNGTRQVWDDRLVNRDYWPQISSAAWTRDGRALVFASHVCKLGANLGPCYWEFRKLVKAGRGLQAGPVLLRQDGMNGQAQEPVISPDGGAVIEVRTGPGSGASLVRISLATGTKAVLHRWHTPGPYQVGANEGNFLFAFQQLHPGSDNSRLVGWVADAGFRSLRYPRGA